MSRSLKKGPYINVSLEKKVLAMNESGKKSVVKTWARASMISPISWDTLLQFTTETNLSLFTLLRIWSVISWASLHRHAVLVAIPVTTRSNREKPF